MIKKRWIFFFVALLILCGLGLIDSEIGAGGFWGLDPKVDAANEAYEYPQYADDTHCNKALEHG